MIESVFCLFNGQMKTAASGMTRPFNTRVFTRRLTALLSSSGGFGGPYRNNPPNQKSDPLQPVSHAAVSPHEGFWAHLYSLAVIGFGSALSGVHSGASARRVDR